MGSQSAVLVNNRNIHPSSKMNRSLFNTLFAVSPLLVFVLHVPRVPATVPLVVGTATVLTAEQITALLAIGLAIKAVTLKAALIAGATRRGRGRRAAEDVAEDIFDIETLVELEEEDILCCRYREGGEQEHQRGAGVAGDGPDCPPRPHVPGGGEVRDSCRLRKTVTKCGQM